MSDSNQHEQLIKAPLELVDSPGLYFYNFMCAGSSQRERLPTRNRVVTNPILKYAETL